MSRVDKRTGQVIYEFTLDPVTRVPVTIDVLVMTGRTKQGTGLTAKEEHAVFKFHYQLTNFGQVDKFRSPRDAGRLLR